MSSAAADKIAAMGLKMPKPAAAANYIMANRVGNTIFTAGHLPQPAEGDLIVGKVGKDLDTEQAYDAARLVALNLCATLEKELGSLDRVKKFVKLTAFVNCVDGFPGQPQVVNGASDFLGEVFGDAGVHSRSAVGTNSLPLNVPVEIEAIVEVHED
jgi:enamine deaminase RidA (YjgF/YER057c/UK114 family)